MNRSAAVAVIAAGALIAGAVGVTSLLSGSSSTATSSIPAPQSLRAYEVGPDYAKVTFGPSIVGPMSITPAPNGRSAIIRWGGSRDDLHPLGITYSFSKNGKTLWAGRQQSHAVVGFTLAVRTFSTCVVPHSQNGFGPKRCTTWTAPP